MIPNIRRVCCREVTSKGRCQSGPQKSVRYNVFATQRFFYANLTVVSSIPKKNVRYTELSALWGVHYKKVSLYNYTGYSNCGKVTYCFNAELPNSQLGMRVGMERLILINP